MPWMRLGWEEVKLLLILNLGTRWGWVVSITPRPRFAPGERTPGTHCIGGWVGPRAGLDAEARRKILCLCRGSNPGRPVRSQTLYWLSYTGSLRRSVRSLLLCIPTSGIYVRLLQMPVQCYRAIALQVQVRNCFSRKVFQIRIVGFNNICILCHVPIFYLIVKFPQQLLFFEDGYLLGCSAV
jgi:hypothetical protein